MHDSGLDPGVSAGLGWYFLLVALMNIYYTVRFYIRHRSARGPFRDAALLFWVLVSMFLSGCSIEYFRGEGLVLSQGLRDLIDAMMGPVIYFVVSVIGFAFIIVFRRLFSSLFFGWLMLDFSLIAIGFSMTDGDFRAIVAKPDNVPISMLIFSVGFLTWLSMRCAVRNDDRIIAGGKPIEADEADKVLTWPDLVYTEMLAMIVCTIILIVWSVALVAPLEPPASSTEIPNPSKAPWYFLGLQEMLVYFDPWLAGVVLPTYIIIGLCAIPYIDFNKKGNGYFTFVERKFAMTTFLFGFVVLWVTLIVLGTFLRGPNWNFFGPYETWTPDKTEALNNVNLSDTIWTTFLGWPLPKNWFAREWPCILGVLGYFLLTPMVLVKFPVRWLSLHSLYVKMGFVRYMVMINILLMMAFLPLKMVLRWVFNLKYLVYIPEYFFNV